MKTILFVSSNKMLGQGLSAVIQLKPEVRFEWAAQLNYRQAIVGADIFCADAVILDAADRTEIEQAFEVSKALREYDSGVKILLLVRPEQASVRKKAVEGKNTGLVDDFVFYDSSPSYLLAKLAAL